MSDVKRYDCEGTYEDGAAFMYECPEGEYVTFEDYKALALRLEAVQKERLDAQIARDLSERRMQIAERRAEITEEYATSRLCVAHRGHWSRERCVLCELELAQSRLDSVKKWLQTIESDGHIDEGWDYDCRRLSELRAIVGMQEPPK